MPNSLKAEVPIIAPSILSANFANLRADIEMINVSEADWIHVDVMDGRFVPNISFGLPIIKAIKCCAEKPLDVHLMIEQPERYLKAFKDVGADRLTVHYEACTHLHRTLHVMKDLGLNVGVALNPHSPISLLADIITDLDQVVIMSVNPGFAGQSFIENTYSKVKELVQLRTSKQINFLIEVDGGVNMHNATVLFKAGVDVLVGGSAIFSQLSDPKAEIANWKNIKSLSS